MWEEPALVKISNNPNANETAAGPRPGFPRDRLSPLTLGTVQLGMPYGITGLPETPPAYEAAAIMDAAWRGGIRCFDSARAYGKAEARIGAWRSAGGGQTILVSKFPDLGSDADPAAALGRHFECSRAALGVTVLDGYLAHRVADLQRPGVVGALGELVAAGRLGAFGASVYGAEQLDRALDVEGMALIQLPASLLDTRLLCSGALERCRARGVVVFTRSAFLQGVLFMDPDALPSHLRAASPALRRLRALAAEADRDIATLALGFLLARAEIDSVVVGAYTRMQLEGSLAAARAAPLEPTLLETLSRLGEGLSDSVLDPSQWPV